VGSGISISSCRDMLQFNVSHHHLNYIAQGKVVACCRSPAAAYTLIKVASEYPDRIQIFPLDMEDQSSIDTFASIMARNYQRVDALFNVAGILGDGQTTSGYYELK